jgi:hypothetical protein
VLKDDGEIRIMVYSTKSLFFHWLRRPWRSREEIRKSYDKNAPITNFYSKKTLKRLLKGFRINAIMTDDGVYGKLSFLDRIFGWWHVQAIRDNSVIFQESSSIQTDKTTENEFSLGKPEKVVNYS